MDNGDRNGMDLASFDWIVINTSAGKDSQAMMDVVVEMAREQGVTDRLVAVHCDLGRMEWQGTMELAKEHAAHYGLPFHVVSRPQGDLFQQIRDRRRSLDAKGKFDAPAWPSSAARFCTSDHKTGQVKKLHTELANRTRAAGGPACPRILDVLGLRGEESRERAKKPVLEKSKAKSSGKKEVWTWNPILDWDEAAVWARIEQAGTRPHEAYSLGMRRLSCVFCVFATDDDLRIAGTHNPELLAEGAALETEVRSTIKKNFALADLHQELVQITQAA